jgi:YrbI family 3-deoxy-D-manno-octulosonate 8-phosphate phosphatase
MKRTIKLVVFDFDGVFTNNKVYSDRQGHETICCYRSDGIGLQMLRDNKIGMLVLSTETNTVLKARCLKLGIGYHITKDKGAAMKEIVEVLDIPLENICYVGNDTPDLVCMKMVGFPIAVKDAYPSVIKAAKYVTKRTGGNGAVREVCELICGD